MNLLLGILINASRRWKEQREPKAATGERAAVTPINQERRCLYLCGLDNVLALVRL